MTENMFEVASIPQQHPVYLTPQLTSAARENAARGE